MASNLAGTKIRRVNIEELKEFKCKKQGKILQHGA